MGHAHFSVRINQIKFNQTYINTQEFFLSKVYFFFFPLLLITLFTIYDYIYM